MTQTRTLALHVLASGSKGNAAVVENAVTGEGVLIDCGICKRDFFARCAEASFDVRRLRAVLVTHEHTDHTKGLGVVLRGLAREGVRPAVYAHALVQKASADVRKAREMCEVRDLVPGERLTVAGMDVEAFPTSHDATFSCGFRVECAGDVLGYVTDTGVLGPEAQALLENVRILALEANHDTRMLADGSYPYAVKRRIAGEVGHLSNVQAAEALARLLSPQLEQVVAMHLSENNNLPSLAVRALRDALAQHTHGACVSCASQRMLTSVR